jgi:DNA-binding FadR family transcriptional regulator
MLQAVEPQRLYRQIAERIRAAIALGDYRPGSRLPAERELAQQLGVSRPSLREALIALEVEGRIEVRTGSGIYVLDGAAPGQQQASNDAHIAPRQADSPQEWGPLEVLRARQVFEVEIAAMAATHARRVDLQAIGAALAQMQQQAASGQAPRPGDEAFHLAVAKACGNDVLYDAVWRTWQARDSALFERLGDYFEHPSTWVQAIEEHEQVYQAICKQDAKAARRAMQHHLRQAMKRYSASWRRAPSR